MNHDQIEDTDLPTADRGYDTAAVHAYRRRYPGAGQSSVAQPGGNSNGAAPDRTAAHASSPPGTRPADYASAGK